VRADEALAGVKILMLTAKGRDTDVAKGLGAGRRRLHDQALLDQGPGRRRCASCWGGREASTAARAGGRWRPAGCWRCGLAGGWRWCGHARAAERAALAADAGAAWRWCDAAGLVCRGRWPAGAARLYRRHGGAARLAEQAQVLQLATDRSDAALPGSAEVRAWRARSTSWCAQRAR
jgi:hypothetical protein